MDVAKEYSRIIVEKNNDSTVITIHSKKAISNIITLSIFVCGSILLMIYLFNSDSDPVSWHIYFYFFIMIIILAVGLRSLYLLIWAITGKEIITVYANKIIIDKVAIYSNTKEYDTYYIKNIRVEQDTSNNWNMSLGFIGAMLAFYDGLITFNYNKKTITFGQELEEREALDIVEQITTRLDLERNLSKDII